MTTDKDQSHDPLRCDEHFPSSPGLPTSDSYMEYGTTMKKELFFFAYLTVFFVCGVPQGSALGPTLFTPNFLSFVSKALSSFLLLLLSLNALRRIYTFGVVTLLK